MKSRSVGSSWMTLQASLSYESGRSSSPLSSKIQPHFSPEKKVNEKVLCGKLKFLNINLWPGHSRNKELRYI